MFEKRSRIEVNSTASGFLTLQLIQAFGGLFQGDCIASIIRAGAPHCNHCFSRAGEITVIRRFFKSL
jgi:hypothetical protein